MLMRGLGADPAVLSLAIPVMGEDRLRHDVCRPLRAALMAATREAAGLLRRSVDRARHAYGRVPVLPNNQIPETDGSGCNKSVA